MNSSPLPTYTRIFNQIKAAIERGDFAPGDQLPSQRELCGAHHASLMTIRRVIDNLNRAGIIQSIPGKGIFVRQQKLPNEYGSLIGFEDQMARLGLHPASRTLDARIIPATTFLAQMLNIQPDSPVVYIFRLRFANKIPMSLYKAYLPHSLCPGILEKGLAEGSLFSILRNSYHLKLVGSRNTASAILPDAETTKYFAITEPVALLLREQITYLDTGEIIEYSRNITPGDSFCVQYDEGHVF